MAIETLDQALAGMLPLTAFFKAITPAMVVGRPQSLWGLGGAPGAGSFSSSRNGEILTNPVAGQIPFPEPTGGDSSYLARLTGAATQAGGIMLVDRIWQSGGYDITSTAAQTIVSPAWPARDRNGATLGDGVILGVEVTSTTGAGTPTITVEYTSSAGVTGRTGTNIIATTASATAGAFYPMRLQSGDIGVRSPQSLTLSATWTSGSINLVAYRMIAVLELPLAQIMNAIDLLTSGFGRIYNGSVLALILHPQLTTASNVSGSLIVTQG